MLKLKNFVMIWSPEDDVIRPAESGKFGFYKIQTKDMPIRSIMKLSVNDYDKLLLPIVELQDSIQYKEDWIGLRTLNESGRLHIFETNCTHSGHKSELCFPQLEELTFPFL
jgi:palmitoyl-protein thioesterase